MRILDNIQGSFTELQDCRVHNVSSLTTGLTAAYAGKLEYVTSTGRVSVWDSTQWRSLTAGIVLADLALANGSLIIGSGGVATAIAKTAIPLSGFGAAAANVDMGTSYRITNLADPTSAQDAATKNYVDATAQGLDAKNAVDYHFTGDFATAGNANFTATTITSNSNGTLGGSDGAPTPVLVNTTILVSGLALGARNGLYKLTDAGSAGTPWVLTRTDDANTGPKLEAAFVFVRMGTVYANSGWVQTADNITLGTTAITWTQFSGAGTYSAGNGLVLSGNTFHFQGSGTYTAGDLFYASSASAVSKLAIGTINRFSYSTGSAPAWSAYAMPAPGSTLTLNGMLYASSTTQVSQLTVPGAASVLVTNGSGLPAFGTDLPTAVTIGGSYVYRVTGTDVALTDGGTNASLTAVNGGITYSTASALALSAAGTSNQLLISNGAAAPSWISQVSLTQGGTNASLTAVNGGITYSTASAMAISAAGTSNQLLISNGAAAPSWISQVSVAQGGTGVATFTTNGVLYGNAATSVLATAAGGTNSVLTANGGAPSFSATPTLSGLTLTGVAASGGSTTLTVTPGAHTAVIAESIAVNFAPQTITVTGNYTNQRFVLFSQPTINAASTLTVTNPATVTIAGAPTVSGSAITVNAYALWVQAGVSYFQGTIWAGSSGTVLTDSAGKILSAALNTVNVAQGGTGATTLTGYVYGNGTGAFTASTTIPVAAISGVLPITQGGTGANLSAVNGGIIHFASGIMAASAAGSARQILFSGGTGAPTWSPYTLPATVAANDLLLASSSSVMASLSTTANRILMTDGSGNVSWGGLINPARNTANGVARKISQLVAGDNTNTYISYTHNLNTRDIVVATRVASASDATTIREAFWSAWEIQDNNTVRIYFNRVQTSSDYYVITVMG